MLLIVLSTFIVGFAIWFAVFMFDTQAVEHNRNGVAMDLNTIAALAQQYYKKPTFFGGGGNSFSGFSIPHGFSSTANGVYVISTAGTAAQIIFQGTGTEIGEDQATVIKLQATVTANSVVVTKLN